MANPVPPNDTVAQFGLAMPPGGSNANFPGAQQNQALNQVNAGYAQGAAKPAGTGN